MSGDTGTVPGGAGTAPRWGLSARDWHAHARVWLVAGLGNAPPPTDRPIVRDDQMRIWQPSPDGRYCTGDGRHHATWEELHARHDLVEVMPDAEHRMAEAILAGTR